MQRRGAAEGDHGVAREILAVLHRMNAGGVGHVLVDDLDDAEGRRLVAERQTLADGILHRLP